MASEKTAVRTTTAEDMKLALARAVAMREVPDEVISSVAKRLASDKLRIRGIDICAYGICLDYFFHDESLWELLPEILKVRGARVHSITVFPWGIPWPDIFRVRVEQQFDDLAPFMPTLGH